MNADLYKDVIKHEYFHLVTLIDQVLIADTGDALCAEYGTNGLSNHRLAECILGGIG